ncbi:hypothetical protein ACFQS1_33475, partial [Paractinoplanes rhizophilus]
MSVVAGAWTGRGGGRWRGRGDASGGGKCASALLAAGGVARWRRRAAWCGVVRWPAGDDVSGAA